MNQLCKVCGEPAAGFHFGAFTCEGCKSFFGRTYNNLAQIHECKNGGVCIINKQNRTSCKACRLRKCLIVGMSKSGSRYGRRSNWFKIHCLLQEQASNLNQHTPNFRSPATPTLQDGSLPFVAAQMKEKSVPETINLSPSINTSVNLSGHSPVPNLNVSPHIVTSFAQNNLIRSERAFHDGLLRISQRPPPPPHISPSVELSCYKESFLNLLQQAHNVDPLWHTQKFQNLIPTHRKEEERPSYHYDRGQWDDVGSSRGREDVGSLEIKKEVINIKSSPKPVGISIIESAGQDNNSDKESDNQIEQSKSEDKDKTSEDPSTKSEDESEPPLLSGEERLQFLKNVNNIPNPYKFPNRSSIPHPSLRLPDQEDVSHRPTNNNFLIPPYGPLWSSMLNFSPFSKLYSQLYPPNITPHLPFNHIKPPYSLFPVYPEQESIGSTIPKEDPVAKKRLLDVILQVQKEHSSSPSQSPASSPTQTPLYSPTSHELPLSSGDQPMDLSVRRKRKMDKSEIMFKPVETQVRRDTSNIESIKEINKLCHPRRSVSPNIAEAPLKLIKLDVSGE